MDGTHPRMPDIERRGSTFPQMSVCTSQHNISKHNSSIFIYTPVRTWQLVLPLNCFNLHY